jgi:hypothetical protein
MASIHTSWVMEKGRVKPAYVAPSSSTLPASALGVVENSSSSRRTHNMVSKSKTALEGKGNNRRRRNTQSAKASI